VASPEVLRDLLAHTSLPRGLIEEFLAETNALWTFGVPDEVVASEAILCHPPLAPDEVRAIVDPVAGMAGWRITLVTADRPGLLAGTAGTLALEGLSVLDAAVTVLPTSRLALQRLTAVPLPGGSRDDGDWDQLGRRLRASVGRSEPVRVPFEGRGPVTVDVQPQGDGRVVVTVDAPDVPGLLWAAADWFGTHGGNVEACRAGVEGARARDVFIVSGPVDGDELAARLGGARTRAGRMARVATWPLGVGITVLRHLNRQLSPPDRP
jgi:predicted amino acid-binding ACT domain protein